MARRGGVLNQERVMRLNGASVSWSLIPTFTLATLLCLLKTSTLGMGLSPSLESSTELLRLVRAARLRSSPPPSPSRVQALMGDMFHPSHG